LRRLLTEIGLITWLAASVASGLDVVVAPGETVSVSISQERADVVIRVVGPAGETWDVDWLRSPRPEEALLAEPGRYRISRFASKEQASRLLPALVLERRSQRPEDRARAAVGRRLARAAELLRRGHAGDAAEARRALEEAMEALQALGDSRRVAEARLRLGEALLAKGDVAAEEHCAAALAAFEALGERAGAVDARIQIGLVNSWRGNTAAAVASYESALPEARALGDRVSEALIEANLGTAFVYLGESQKALDHFRAAIALARTAGARRAEGWALTNLARLWHSLGEGARALDCAREGSAVLDRAGDTKGRIAALLNTGVILNGLARWGEAARVLERGLRLATASGQTQAEATVRGRLGDAYAGQGDSERAILAYRAALALYRKQGARRAQGLVLANLGAAQLRAGDLTSARSSLEEARALGRSCGDPTVEASALHGLAGVFRTAGEIARARETSEQALAVVESLRVQVGSADLRSSYFASVQDYYEQHVGILLAEEGHAEAAFHTSERARARALLDGLAGGRSAIRTGVALDWLERQAALKKAVERASARYIRLLAAAGPEAEAVALEKEMAALAAQDQELQGELRARSPRYAALTQPKPLTVEEVQRDLLDDETALVEIALGEARSHAFVIERGAFRVAVLPARRVLEPLAAAALREAGVRPTATPARAPLPALRALGQALLAPLGTIEARRLVFVTQGALQSVPFGALRTSAGGAPLLARHEIVTLPSASTLDALRRQVAGRAAASPLVAVLADPVFDPADPRLPRLPSPSPAAAITGPVRDLTRFARLPFTRREASAISKTAGAARVATALGFDATRERALSPELATARVLHFATHGVTDDARPELSGLVLSLFDARGAPRDGFLRLADIYNLDLAADLVVLSACRTGLGKNVRGEGLVGLARAFMYAGAPRVVTSLWTVDDAATAALMADFYRILLVEGRPPSEALRGAQLRMQQQPRWRHPYFWAAFTLQGEWR